MNKDPTAPLIWDWPLRLFHWLLAGAVAGAVATAWIGGNLMLWHGRLGAFILGLVAFRLVWGLVGSNTSRFSQFVTGPGAIIAYLRGQWQGIGHNPLGALSVLALLGILTIQAVTGDFAHDDIAFQGPLAQAVAQDTRDSMTRWHRLSANLLLGLVALHLAAIAYYRVKHKQDLVRPMLTGRGPSPSGTGTSGGPWYALVLAVLVGVSVAWGFQGTWLAPPPAPVTAPVHDW